jgi:bifunctional UDP-N-acetylglucosamine pyrophosphorylase / glucosamine-1-phosphate N-acetyltransferase
MSLGTISAIILAAGQGTRMKSSLPKVLHPVCGRPIVHYPVRAALEAGCGEVVVVVGHGREAATSYLQKAFGDRVKIAVQEQQKGTGDAASAGIRAVSSAAELVLIFNGDLPLIETVDVSPVAASLGDDPRVAIGMATCEVPDPTGYGRIMRDASGDIIEIREHKDLRTDAERAIREMNPGLYGVRAEFLRKALADLKPNNAQGEYYLTDIIAQAVAQGRRVLGVRARAEVMDGVNDRQQLAEVEAEMAERLLRKWRTQGVTVRTGARIDDGVVLGKDVTVESGVVLRGDTQVGEGAFIDVGCVLTNVSVAEGAVLKPYTVAQDSKIGPRAQVGPFAHLRPDSVLGEDVHIGNFVETKKTTLHKGAKANHLAYLGDGQVGAGANIGAGTIFCNYDGFQKHTTIIEEGAFIGSDSQLVAPVRVGKNAYVGTGTCVTKDVPDDALAISRVPQSNKEGYGPKLRARMAAAKAAAQKKA